MPWLTRGLRDGIVTTRYPRHRDGYGPGFRGAVRVRGDAPPPGDVAGVCPTGAIEVTGDALRVDRGRCILCGRCVERHPDLFAMDPSPEVAARARAEVVVPTTEDDASLDALRQSLAQRVRGLRRSVHVRHVDVGSDGSEEWEIAALFGPIYDMHRLGIFLTPSPRHADLLLATGAGSAGMLDALAVTYEAMPHPKVVVAAGTDAISGGLVSPTYATRGGIGEVVPVDVWVPGSPPSPFSILGGILLAIGRLPGAGEST